MYDSPWSPKKLEGVGGDGDPGLLEVIPLSVDSARGTSPRTSLKSKSTSIMRKTGVSSAENIYKSVAGGVDINEGRESVEEPRLQRLSEFNFPFIFLLSTSGNRGIKKSHRGIFFCNVLHFPFWGAE